MKEIILAGGSGTRQAIESYWSIRSNDISTNYSIKAIRLVLENIYYAVTEPKISNRVSLQEAAFLAGKAINITKPLHLLLSVIILLQNLIEGGFYSPALGA